MANSKEINDMNDMNDMNDKKEEQEFPCSENLIKQKEMKGVWKRRKL